MATLESFFTHTPSDSNSINVMFFRLLRQKSALLSSLVSVKILICSLFVLTTLACSDSSTGQANAQMSTQTAVTRNASVPDYVIEVLQYVKEQNKAPEGYVGGRRFGNYEKRLPQKTNNGSIIHYREWDVFPKIKNKSRGAERLVTGSDRSAWYTSDHYNSFIQIK